MDALTGGERLEPKWLCLTERVLLRNRSGSPALAVFLEHSGSG